MNILVRRPHAIVAALVAALALVLLPGIPAHAASPGSATLTFTREGEPASFAFVSLAGPDGPTFTSTGPDGVLVLTDLALGAYSGSVNGDQNTQPALFAFELTTDQPSHAESIALLPWPSGTGSVAGVVTDATTGAPLEGASVSFFQLGASRPFPAQTTASDGAFQYSDLVAGHYSVSVYLAGYFSVMSHDVVLADGEAAVIPLPLVRQDAAITGRVTDDTGIGLEGITVAAMSGANSGFATTGATGVYTIPDLGEGTWTVSLGGTGWPWAYASTSVDLVAGSTATASDLIAVARTTGSVSGLVMGTDQAPEEAGLVGVCVTLTDVAGMPIPGYATVTESAGSYWLDGIEAGDYLVRFEDCDPARVPPYATTYLGSTDPATATVVTVEPTADVWLDYTSLDRVVEQPEPDHDAKAVPRRDLTTTDRDLIGAPPMLRRGETAQILVGSAYAGQWVSVWLHSRPTQLGAWHQVSPEGTVEITIPRQHPIGVHELVVQDAADQVIGWTDLRVRLRITCLFPWLPTCT